MALSLGPGRARRPVPALWELPGRSRHAGAESPGAVVPDNPCYGSNCGPTQPVVVDNPTAGPGSTIVHPNGQTDLWAVNAPQAWAVTKGSSKILVAVLDTGVDVDQPQLAQKVVVAPPECSHDEAGCATPYDGNGHGTFVAGVIGAATNDGIGIAGLGWDTKVLDIKVLNNLGDGNTLDEAKGIYAAVADGAKVINLSSDNYQCGHHLAPSTCGLNTDQEKAVEYAVAHGVVVVAAAGNYGDNRPVYPADYPGVLSVAYSTDQGTVDPINGGPYLDMSDYGHDANIAAPGVNVLSTWDDGNYAVESGTSVAAPHVSAAAALVMAAGPHLSGPQVATLLLETASPLTPGGRAIDGGFLDVGAAVRAAAARPAFTSLDGFQVVSGDGTARNGGVEPPEGPAAGRHSSSQVVGAAETRRGLGCWMVSSEGRVLAFGDAAYHGSLARRRLLAPIVGMAATPDGRGYWLVGSDGAVYGFGDAHLFGSAAKLHLSRPIVGMAATPDGRGYWLVGSDGGVFNFGDAGYYGSGVGRATAVVGMAPSPDGRGYWLAGKGGRVWAFGSAPEVAISSRGAHPSPVVAIAS
ncbi:MAG: S8 family serine peptidase [Acidimicrobiales bacterium]